MSKRRRFDYRAYLLSPEWAALRTKALRRWGWRCAVCGASGPLECHHTTYKLPYFFRLYSLLPLCPPCHAAWHGRLGAAEARVE